MPPARNGRQHWRAKKKQQSPPATLTHRVAQSHAVEDSLLLADVPARISACTSIEQLISTCKAVIDAARRDLRRSPSLKVWPHYSHEEISAAVAELKRNRKKKKKE